MTESTQDERRERFPLSAQILVGMLLGLIVGPLLGTNAIILGTAGKIMVQLVKIIAAPLLFFAVVSAVAKTEVDAKSGFRMVVIATTNAVISLLVGLTLTNLIRPGEYLTGVALSKVPASASNSGMLHGEKLDYLKALENLVPSSIVHPFYDNMIISIVLLALLLGFGIRALRKQDQAEGLSTYSTIEDLVTALLRISETILGWVVKLVPFAVFGAVARATGEFGFSPLKGLAMYVAMGLFGLTLHILVTYQFWIKVSGIPLGRFWHVARTASVYAFGANSSLATLPLTLKALDRLGISRTSSTLGACVGTNLNNDGIIYYEVMAVLFVAQAMGIHLSLGQQLAAAVACMIAAAGVAGVPEAGFISLSLVLTTVGLPVELLPLLLTVDWILARARSVTNVLSDMVVSIVLERWRVGRPLTGQ